MENLPLIPIEDSVVFPGMTVTLALEVGDAERVFLVPRHGEEFGSVGTVAQVADRMKLPGGIEAIAFEGLYRGVAGAAATGTDGRLRVDVTEHHDDSPTDEHTRELEREYRAVVDEILEVREADPRIQAFLRSIAEPGQLADTAGYSPDLSFDQKRELLETLDVTTRLEKAVAAQRERLAELQVRKRIRDDVESGAQEQQREYFLRKQMESIRKELGEDETSVVDDFRKKIEDAGMPDAVREQAERELDRFERMGEGGGEGSMIRTYLDWLLSVPWGERSEERLDPAHAREVLDADHAGLEDVKDRITEYIAVRKLRKDREIEDERGSGAILTLIGPPGTGKTSIGESIARATGREFVRMSLGGVRDEAEIRGHRRTYIGALPGRLVRALRDAGTMNPVIMLDEVDKVGADWRGDPSAALLEVLDPAQNHSFRDHYLDVELDLSGVLFIATANIAETIPAPLLDRMEVVRFDGYTTDEKVAIAEGYLWPRQRERNGLRPDEVEMDAEAIRTVITEYTREAGVRNLERELGKALRKIATRIASGEATAPVQVDVPAIREALGRQRFFQEAAERTAVPGVATGLSVTNAGGDVLFIEATAMPGKDDLVLTGQLGDVMKESARIALSFVRSRAEELGHRRGRVRRPPVPRARPRRGDPEGRPQRRDHDDHGIRVAPERPARQARRRDDRRDHAPGPRAADRRPEAEGPGGARRRPGRGDPPGAQPRRPGGRARGRPRADALPPRHDDRRGAGARARAHARRAPHGRLTPSGPTCSTTHMADTGGRGRGHRQALRRDRRPGRR